MVYSYFIDSVGVNYRLSSEIDSFVLGSEECGAFVDLTLDRAKAAELVRRIQRWIDTGTIEARKRD